MSNKTQNENKKENYEIFFSDQLEYIKDEYCYKWQKGTNWTNSTETFVYKTSNKNGQKLEKWAEKLKWAKRTENVL